MTMQKNRINFQIIPAYQAKSAESLDAATTLGIEVTVPTIAAKCGLGNIDHHGEGCTHATPAACEQILSNFFDWMFSPHGEERLRGQHLCKQIFNACTDVVGTMLDSDTLVSMCLIKIYEQDFYYHNLYDMYELVKMIGAVDRLGASSAKDADGNKYADDDLIKAIMAVSGSRSMTIEQKMDEVIKILTRQEVSTAAQKAVEASDRLFNDAKEASKVTILDRGIVFVESTKNSATRIGYEHGDILICLNEKMLKDFKNPDAGTYRKYTVCKRNENVQAVIDYNRLNELEQADGTWAGRSIIGGSPQGVDSTLAVEQVLRCIHTPWRREGCVFARCRICRKIANGGEDINGDWVCVGCASTNDNIV